MRMICPGCGKQETEEEQFQYRFREHDTCIYLCNSCAKDGKYEAERHRLLAVAIKEGRLRH